MQTGQRAADSGDTVWLLLDVNQGCLDVFLNGERLGKNGRPLCEPRLRSSRRERRERREEERAEDDVEDEGDEGNDRDGLGRAA